jgi:hypothetical protein
MPQLSSVQITYSQILEQAPEQERAAFMSNPPVQMFLRPLLHSALVGLDDDLALFNPVVQFFCARWLNLGTCPWEPVRR